MTSTILTYLCNVCKERKTGTLMVINRGKVSPRCLECSAKKKREANTTPRTPMHKHPWKILGQAHYHRKKEQRYG